MLLLLSIQYEHTAHEFEAELFTDLAPQTCTALCTLLPLEHSLINARWSGPMGILRRLPLGSLPLENAQGFLQPGDLLFHAPHQDAGLAYGITQFKEQTGPVYVSVFGRIRNRLDELHRMGMLFQDVGALRLSLRLL